MMMRIPLATLVALAVSSAAASASPQGSIALTVLPAATQVASGTMMQATLTVRSTGTQSATAVTACLTAPLPLTVARAAGAKRTGRQACFTLGDLPAGAETSRTVVLRAAAARTANVRLAAQATSACQCSGKPRAFSPVIRVVPGSSRPRVTG